MKKFKQYYEEICEARYPRKSKMLDNLIHDLLQGVDHRKIVSKGDAIAFAAKKYPKYSEEQIKMIWSRITEPDRSKVPDIMGYLTQGYGPGKKK